MGYRINEKNIGSSKLDAAPKKRSKKLTSNEIETVAMILQSGHKNTDEMVVDHCHKTKKVRGLLCNRCNTLLGNVNEDISILQETIKYIKRHI